VTYIPKVGDRVNWYSDVLYTVTAIGKRRALVVDENGMEYAPDIINLTPIPDDVTIEVSREDAEELVRVVDERDDLRAWLHGTSWTLASELRLKAKLQAALAGEK